MKRRGARPLEFIFIAEIATVHEVARLFIGWIILRDERVGPLVRKRRVAPVKSRSVERSIRIDERLS